MEQDTSLNLAHPSLPQDDTQLQQALREQTLTNQQALYQWNDHSPNLSQVPLALKVPSQDEPTLEWKGLVTIAVAEVSINLLAVLADLPLSDENKNKYHQLKQSYQLIAPVVEQLADKGIYWRL